MMKSTKPTEEHETFEIKLFQTEEHDTGAHEQRAA